MWDPRHLTTLYKEPSVIYRTGAAIWSKIKFGPTGHNHPWSCYTQSSERLRFYVRHCSEKVGYRVTSLMVDDAWVERASENRVHRASVMHWLRISVPLQLFGWPERFIPAPIMLTTSKWALDDGQLLGILTKSHSNLYKATVMYGFHELGGSTAMAKARSHVTPCCISCWTDWMGASFLRILLFPLPSIISLLCIHGS
jgi:hypothetical protein